MTHHDPHESPRPEGVTTAAVASDRPTHSEPRWRNGAGLFEHAFRSVPDQPGVHYFDATLTFGELGERAHALAHALRHDFGIAPGDRIALMLQNVPAVPVVVHAALLVGAVVVPVSAMLQPDELQRHLDLTRPRLAVTLESLHERFVGLTVSGATIDLLVTSELEDLHAVPALLEGSSRIPCPGAHPLAAVIESHRGHFVDPHPSTPESAAVLASTSGTTGVAKAAVITHDALVQAAHSLQTWVGLEPGQVTVAVAPMFHITGLTGHLATSRAACSPLLLMFRFEPGEMLRLVEKWKGHWMLGPSTCYLALARHPDITSRDLSSLHHLHSGGAPLPQAVVDDFEARTGKYLHNVYGLTETATPCHGVAAGMRAPVDPETGAVSVGRPLPGVQARLLSFDGTGEPGPGEAGELVLRSPALASGYWERPDETAIAFRDGWFHTGDLAKRDEEGNFFVVDRIKDMIIASGFKVSPRDVEEVLMQHSDIVDVAVIGAPDDYRGETVKAFVVLEDGVELDVAALRDYCRSRLSAYKVPTHVEAIPLIPRNASGKVLKRTLRTTTPHTDNHVRSPQ